MATLLKKANGRATAIVTTDTAELATITANVKLVIDNGSNNAVLELNDYDVNEISNDTGLADASATALVTELAIKTYVDAQLGAADLDFTTDTAGNSSIDLDDQTLTISSGAGMAVTHSLQTITVAGIDSTAGADDANSTQGIASFSSNDFGAASGHVTIKALGVSDAQLAGSISNAKLSNNTVSFGGVALALGATDATPAFDLQDATGLPTTSLTGTVTNTQLAGSIVNGKLVNSTIGLAADSGSNTTIDLGDLFTFDGTANEIETTVSTDKITIGLPNDVTISNNLIVTNDLTVNGTTTTLSTTNMNVEDANILIGALNAGSDVIDGSGLTLKGGQADDVTLGWLNSKLELKKGANFANMQVGTLTGALTGNVDGNATGSSGSCTGLAATATALATARDIVLSGDVSGSASFNGTGNATITATIQANSVALAADTTGDYVQNITAGTGLTSGGATSGENIAHSLSVDANQGQVTTVGALNAGSITNGFTSIDVGSGAISTTGTATIGILNGGASGCAAQNLVMMNGVHAVLAGEDLLANEPVALALHGGVLKAFAADNAETGADSGAFDSIVGICRANTTSGANADVLCTPGSLVTKPAASGNLTVGSPVYVGADGGVVTAAPGNANTAVVKMGVATSTSTYLMDINLQLVN